MAGSVRYCILCGSEIGDALDCPNADCGGIPNFYRDVPGPTHKDRRPSGKHQARDQRTEPLPASESEPALAESERNRVTMPLEAAPIALLRSVAEPRVEHPLYPGRTDVGARRPAQIIIDRPQISSRHARLACGQAAGGQWKVVVIDCDSTNGTYVNGERVRRTELKEGDRISFADVEYELRFPAAEEPRVTMQL